MSPPDPTAGPPRATAWRRAWLRPKGHLSSAALAALAALALAPLLSVGIRVLTMPGIVEPELGALRTIGGALNQLLSLSTVPAAQRDQVLYLLFLPTCALLVALARLTLGFRVLGFRSILIAVGFHQSGIIPSLLLITVAVAAIVLVRPWLRRVRLPYYARVSVILCIVATTMASALLAGPWMRADVLWGVAAFPVIVLGMLAEGVARTLDRDNVVTATWRAISTILLAFVIALVCWVPALRGFLLQFPELVLTQIVAIVLISEYLDLRLFQDWDLKAAGLLATRLPSRAAAPRVAVICDPPDVGSPGRAARPWRVSGANRTFVRALKRAGYAVTVLEAGPSLPGQLRRFSPAGPANGGPSVMVLDLTRGTRGGAPPTRVAALLELSGVPYVGPTPQGHAMATDRVATRLLLGHAGVPTPPFRVMTRPGGSCRDLPYPALVTPRHEPGTAPRIVADRQELRRAVRRVVRRYRKQAVVEPFIAGREIRAALLGNAPIECLPLVELDRERREKVCPAPLEPGLAERIRACATAAFLACGCRDYARIDFRIDAAGVPWVLAVHTRGILVRGGSFARAAAAAGYPFDRLARRIVEVARTRQLSGAPAWPIGPRSSAGPPADGPTRPKGRTRRRHRIPLGQDSPARDSTTLMPASNSAGSTMRLATRKASPSNS